MPIFHNLLSQNILDTRKTNNLRFDQEIYLSFSLEKNKSFTTLERPVYNMGVFS